MPLQPRFVIADHTFTFIRVLVELPIARGWVAGSRM